MVPVSTVLVARRLFSRVEIMHVGRVFHASGNTTSEKVFTHRENELRERRTSGEEFACRENARRAREKD